MSAAPIKIVHVHFFVGDDTEPTKTIGLPTQSSVDELAKWVMSVLTRHCVVIETEETR